MYEALYLNMVAESKYLVILYEYFKSVHKIIGIPFSVRFIVFLISISMAAIKNQFVYVY